MTKEERKEYMKQWGIDNAEHIKQYLKDNKEKINKRRKQYQKDNREEINEKAKLYKIQWCIDNKEEIKEYNKNRKNEQKKRFLIKKYGITQEQYNELYNKQEGKCAICKKHQSELKQALGVDHNHKTGKIRGLLCSKCNRGLGYFNDNKDIVNSAGNYLNEND
jgi:ERCC4-type nuclease